MVRIYTGLLDLVRFYVLNEDISPAYEIIEVHYSIEGWQTVVAVIVIFICTSVLLEYPLHPASEEFYDFLRGAIEYLEHIWRGE